ncbi:DNA ligase/mRNA capping enzyme [Pisolithus sp. B1]|nr:DNA ligase/mRNA capping enzyme [Pisolithus sp. B1]
MSGAPDSKTIPFSLYAFHHCYLRRPLFISQTSFVSLLGEIADLPPNLVSSRTYRSSASNRSARAVATRWVAALRRDYLPLPRGTTATILRFLFPEEDTPRKYGLQEARLAIYLGSCLDSSTVFTRDTRKLKSWSKESFSGCLGEELLKFAIPGTETGPKSLQEIDALLDELAATCQFSDKFFHAAYPSPRSKTTILRALYDSLPATDAAYLTQIILKDLRPLLYAPPATSTSRILLDYNTRSKQVLTKEQFMMLWDPTKMLLQMYKVRARLDEAAMGFEAGGTLVQARPQCGVPIEVPKSAKGRCPQHALELLDSCDRIWAETKYDGERAQIHVSYGSDGEMNISIFSKSKRDSTLDRVAVHPIIKEALSAMPPQPIILDAEMVAFSEQRNTIDEFWRIRGLIARSAEGPRSKIVSGKGEQAHDSHSLDTCPSLHSNRSPDSSDGLHLALVFFDVLLVGHASFLNVPYAMRRSVLENAIREIPGRVIIAKRELISSGPETGIEKAEVWAQKIVDCEEGIVLKAGESVYGDWRLPWVKLKKDYVPGHGDTIDLVVVAAGWDKDRARELRVPPSILTTFYVGALANSSQLKANPDVRPHYLVYFTASYGMTREQLEELNFWIRSDSVDSQEELSGLPYTHSMLQTLPKPSVFVANPILVELCGAGFTKSPQCKYYELRFPRITKTFRPSERSFTECLTLRELQAIAYAAVGREAQDVNEYGDLDEWSRRLWGKQSEDKVQSEEKLVKRLHSKDEWEQKLQTEDLRRRNGKRKREETEMSQ